MLNNQNPLKIYISHHHEDETLAGQITDFLRYEKGHLVWRWSDKTRQLQDKLYNIAFENIKDQVTWRDASHALGNSDCVLVIFTRPKEKADYVYNEAHYTLYWSQYRNTVYLPVATREAQVPYYMRNEYFFEIETASEFYWQEQLSDRLDKISRLLRKVTAVDINNRFPTLENGNQFERFVWEKIISILSKTHFDNQIVNGNLFSKTHHVTLPNVQHLAQSQIQQEELDRGADMVINSNPAWIVEIKRNYSREAVDQLIKQIDQFHKPAVGWLITAEEPGHEVRNMFADDSHFNETMYLSSLNELLQLERNLSR